MKEVEEGVRRRRKKKGRMAMAVDLRQVIAALLTVSMFTMLANMIKKDHIDPLLVNVAITTTSQSVQHGMLKVSEQRMAVKLISSLSSNPWKEDGAGAVLKPCRPKPSLEIVRQQPKGYIYLSLTDGPEFHASQISNAIIIAKQLGAALVLPDIIDVKAREKRQFGEIYDTHKFLTSLDGIIQVVKSEYPSIDKSRGRVITTVRVSNRVSKEFIEDNIQPLFKRHRRLRIISKFTTSTAAAGLELENVENPKYMVPYDCLVMYGSLELKPELNKLVETMSRTLQHLGSNSFGKFIAVDWNVEEFQKNGCEKRKNNVSNNSPECFDGKQIGLFLKKMGFESDTAIYLTQVGWHHSLNSLRQYFPNTFTKDAIIPRDLKPKYLGRDKFELGKFIDLKLCAQSDVFVSTFHEPFHINVVGMRIISGKTKIYELGRTTSATDYRSPYITRKTHTVYSCFC